MGKEKHLDRSIACRFTFAIDLTTRQAGCTLCLGTPLLKELRHQPRAVSNNDHDHAGCGHDHHGHSNQTSG